MDSKMDKGADTHAYNITENQTDWDAIDPLARFAQWLEEAQQSEPNDPNAAALATADAAGTPSVRMVLVKRADRRGFCFFTNAESRKGTDLAVNPQAALCFHWKTLRRQVRVTGKVTELPAGEADTYFHTRSRGSQLGAAVSQQSRPLASRATLEKELQLFTAEHPAEVPRPPFWRGYSIRAHQIEFWLDGPDRLHNRFLFTHALTDGKDTWKTTRLYP